MAKKVDLLQILIDSEQADLNNLKESNERKAVLTTEDMTAHGVLTFLASYDTTGSALTHVMYYLAANEEIQEKVYLEIQELGEYFYDDLAQLKYLTAVINETLCLCPPPLLIPRVSVQDIKLQGSCLNQ